MLHRFAEVGEVHVGVEVALDVLPLFVVQQLKRLLYAGAISIDAVT